MVVEVHTLDDPDICVLIVEDHEPFREYIIAKLRTQTRLQIVSEVGDGAEAVQQVKRLQPDLVLLDVGLPTLNGIEVARQIQEASPNTKIIFVSENRSSDVAEEALRAGALGYVVKSDAEKDLLPGIDAVLQGRRFLSTTLAGQMLMTAALSPTLAILCWILTL